MDATKTDIGRFLIATLMQKGIKEEKARRIIDLYSLKT